MQMILTCLDLRNRRLRMNSWYKNRNWSACFEEKYATRNGQLDKDNIKGTRAGIYYSALKMFSIGFPQN